MSEMDLTENWQIIPGETFSVRYAYVGIISLYICWTNCLYFMCFFI